MVQFDAAASILYNISTWLSIIDWSQKETRPKTIWLTYIRTQMFIRTERTGRRQRLVPYINSNSDSNGAQSGIDRLWFHIIEAKPTNPNSAHSIATTFRDYPICKIKHNHNIRCTQNNCPIRNYGAFRWKWFSLEHLTDLICKRECFEFVASFRLREATSSKSFAIVCVCVCVCTSCKQAFQQQ